MRTDHSTDEHSGKLPLALIGFGEAGLALAEGWHGADVPVEITAFDIKSDSPTDAVAQAMWDRYDNAGISGSKALPSALAPAMAVFSLVTADQATSVAKAAAQHIAPGTLFFDCNSCAPAAKRASAQMIETAGGRYVDTAIMAPIRPRLHQTPMLVSGPHAPDAHDLMTRLDMNARVLDGPVGHASSVKMIRSVMVKGIEALTAECVLAARKAGVEDEVLASLDASMPGWDWAPRAARNLERSTTHGRRRAAEMREVAQTLADLGLPVRMAPATASWQDDLGGLPQTQSTNTYQERADAILAALETRENGGHP